MTRTTNDSAPDEPTGTGIDHAAIDRLERALAAEMETSAKLRDAMDALGAKVEQIEASFMRKLDEAVRRGTTAERTIADQQKRLEALGNGREESMRLLGRARTELARVSAERDELRKQLARIDGMQTATITLGEEEIEAPIMQSPLPSIEELMASLGSFEERGTPNDNGHLLAAVGRDDDEESQIMIAPELVFPEEYGDEEETKARTTPPPRVSRLLVLLDYEQPIKYPLYKNVMTIGRSEQADIQINSDFISRVHARLVCTDDGVVVEDVDSKNGIRVNSKPVDRHALRHGDVVWLGKLRFTFIDTAAGGAD